MLFEKLSNKSPRDLILSTWESLRDTHESFIGNTHFDEFILALRAGMKTGEITEEVLSDQRLEHIAADQMSPKYPFLYACVLNELAQQALDNGNNYQSWPLIVQASASAEGAAIHAFYRSEIDTTAALNHRRAIAGAEARKAKFQPAKDYAIILMREKRPKHGWDDFMHAAESIKNELGDFVERQQNGLRRELLAKTLKRWFKEDESFRSALNDIFPPPKQ